MTKPLDPITDYLSKHPRYGDLPIDTLEELLTYLDEATNKGYLGLDAVDAAAERQLGHEIRPLNRAERRAQIRHLRPVHPVRYPDTTTAAGT